MANRFLLQLAGIVAAVAVCVQPAMALDLNLDPFMSTNRVGQPKSDVGVDVKADALDLRGAITTKRAGDATLVVPQFTSSFNIDRDWKLQTQTTFVNWNEQLGSNAASMVETKLTGRSVLPMVNEIEGGVTRDAAGTERKKLRVRMNDATVASIASKPIQLKTNASVEKIAAADGAAASLLTGVEATLAQNTSSTASNRLGLKYTTESGIIESKRQIATVGRSWAQNKWFRLNFEWELMREAANFSETNLQNAIRFSWQGAF